MQNELHTISETHLGDCLLHAHFLNELSNIYPEISFNYYVLDKHIEQVKDFIISDKIIIKSYKDAPSESFRGWVGQFGIPFIPFNLCELRLRSYVTLCERILKLKSPFNITEDLLPSFNENNPTDNEWDILLINSTPLSNQLSRNIFETEFIQKFKHKKIITTKPVKDVPCTLDYNLSVYKIGQLSLFTKKIIGINTGPWFAVMNKNNLQSNKTLYYLDENCKFAYSNCVNIDTLKVFI